MTVTALCPGPVTIEIFARPPGQEQRRRPAHELGADETARAGIEAALRGRAVVVPGTWNKLMVWGARLVPRGVTRSVSAKTSVSYLGLPPITR